MFMSVHVAMVDADAVVTQLHHLRPSRHEAWHVKPEIITPGMRSGAFDPVTLSPARDTLGGKDIVFYCEGAWKATKGERAIDGHRLSCFLKISV